MKSRLKTRALAFVMLLAFAGVAIAGAVTINGTTYVCQHACNVTVLPGGGYGVWDSEGGWMHEYNEDIDGPLQ